MRTELPAIASPLLGTGDRCGPETHSPADLTEPVKKHSSLRNYQQPFFVCSRKQFRRDVNRPFPFCLSGNPVQIFSNNPNPSSFHVNIYRAENVSIRNSTALLLRSVLNSASHFANYSFQNGTPR